MSFPVKYVWIDYYVQVVCIAGNPTQVAIMMKSDARADVLAENARLADDFIKTLFAIVYEVYGSSVHLCCSYSLFAPIYDI